MWGAPTSSSVFFVQGNELGWCYLASTPPPVISPRPVVASTGDASRTPHERSTTRARWALPGTHLVQNGLQCVICVA